VDNTFIKDVDYNHEEEEQQSMQNKSGLSAE
jgi:hypothetical protein